MMTEIKWGRRWFLAISAGAALLPGVGFAQSAVTLPQDGRLKPDEAHRLALAEAIHLIDIRRPEEWAATGSGQGAHRIDLRRADFLTAIDTLVAGDRAAPVALICARGVRSALISKKLRNAGFTNIIDVPEGMMGSRAGPGWIRRNLPLVRN